MKVFLVLLLAHVIADFVTQTTNMIEQKRIFTSRFFSEGLLYHCIHHLGISFILCIVFLEWSNAFLFIIPMVTIAHYFVDVAKLKWEKSISVKRLTKPSGEKPWYDYFISKRMTYFIGDQLIHLASLYIILRIFGYHLSNSEFMRLFTLDIYQTDLVVRYIVLILLFVLVTYPSAYFISILMGDFEDRKVENEIAATLDSKNEQIEHLKEIQTDLVITESYQEVKDNYSLQVQYHKYHSANENPRGRYIGILERILIVIFIVQNLFQGLALIIAMKTLTRFKQFEDKGFAEYYLIGTLLSLMIGIVFATAIKKIW